jgi:hypothetical protein
MGDDDRMGEVFIAFAWLLAYALAMTDAVLLALRLL